MDPEQFVCELGCPELQPLKLGGGGQLCCRWLRKRCRLDGKVQQPPKRRPTRAAQTPLMRLREVDRGEQRAGAKLAAMTVIARPIKTRISMDHSRRDVLTLIGFREVLGRAERPTEAQELDHQAASQRDLPTLAPAITARS
jgi:hypothetical protein